jgi:hypothetical protein
VLVLCVDFVCFRSSFLTISVLDQFSESFRRFLLRKNCLRGFKPRPTFEKDASGRWGWSHQNKPWEAFVRGGSRKMNRYPSIPIQPLMMIAVTSTRVGWSGGCLNTSNCCCCFVPSCLFQRYPIVRRLYYSSVTTICCSFVCSSHNSLTHLGILLSRFSSEWK